MKLSAYLRLMRFDKPIGIFLLWFPSAWGLWVANRGVPTIRLLFYFFLGTVVMRAAGCVVNDMADRDIDKHVKRTHKRPLTQGELSLQEAIYVLIFLCVVALVIVMQLPIACFYYALVALGLTALYPFCKRFIDVPQAILGLAFSMSIPMAYNASGVRPDLSMGLLVVINFTWVIAYDSMYAMVDRADDLRIGVKSTAVLFAHFDRLAILLLQLLFHSLWLVLAATLHLSLWFFMMWLLALFVLIHQQTLIYSRIESQCFKAFLTNSWYGLIMWIALII